MPTKQVTWHLDMIGFLEDKAEENKVGFSEATKAYIKHGLACKDMIRNNQPGVPAGPVKFGGLKFAQSITMKTSMFRRIQAEIRTELGLEPTDQVPKGFFSETCRNLVSWGIARINLLAENSQNTLATPPEIIPKDQGSTLDQHTEMVSAPTADSLPNYFADLGEPKNVYSGHLE